MHIHSGLALNLRYRYRELRDSRESDFMYGIALASLYGHPGSDIKSGIRTVNQRFELAGSCIPYYNIRGRSVEKERERAARLLEILNRNITREMIMEDNKAES